MEEKYLMSEELIYHEQQNSIHMTLNGMSFLRLACHSGDPQSCHYGQRWFRGAKDGSEGHMSL